MEILFDGITIMFLGKSGVYTSIYIHPIVIAFLIFAAVGLYAHRSNKRREQGQPGSGSRFSAFINLSVLLIAVSIIFFIPLNLLICDNAISCSWHPRADNPETWTISPDQIVYKAFEQALATR